MRSMLTASRSAILALGRGSATPGWAILVVGLSITAWLAMLVTMAGMDQGPGTPLHALPAFLLGWIVMLTAMMLPSELNYVGAFTVLLRGRGRSPADRQRTVASFIGGYGAAWLVYGLGAFTLDYLARASGSTILKWDRGGPYLAGAVLIGAGLYQLSPLKQACLKGCRSPLSFFSRYWRDGDLGSFEMGARHGLVCVGCCWALMAVMFAVGSMSLVWMAILTLFMFAEKMFPHGRQLALPIAGFLWIMGIWIIASPNTAPLLKSPLIYGRSICHGY